MAAALVAYGPMVAPAQDEEITTSGLETPVSSEPEVTTSSDQPTQDGGFANVEVTVGELQQLLNLPSSAVIREADEDPSNPPSIFKDNQTVERIFGTNPTFIYYPEGVDPMIIPWVRNRIIAEELYRDATVAEANRDFPAAMSLLRQIREQYPDTKPAESAPQDMARIERLIAQARSSGNQVATDVKGPEANEIVLPEWVKQNTSAVMLSDQPVVLVGNDFLREGDSVPRFATVKVKSISEAEVVYSYQNKDFVVEVVGSF